MILQNYKDFPRSGRILGLDWGARRCGVAVSDEKRDFVFIRPQINIKNQNELLDAVLRLISEEKAVGLVMGLPLYADGTDSETTKTVREFANMLAIKTDLPIIFIEENLTSATAEQEIGHKNMSKMKQTLDSVSARIILENAIAMLNRPTIKHK